MRLLSKPGVSISLSQALSLRHSGGVRLRFANLTYQANPYGKKSL